MRRKTVLVVLAVALVASAAAAWYLPASAKPVAWLLYDLESGSPNRVFRARMELAKRGEPRAIPVLLRQLDTPDDTEAGYAGRALAAIGEPAIDPLVGALASESTDLRANAAYALGQIGDARALEPLKNALADRAKEVRDSASRALVGIRSSGAVEALLALMAGTDRDVAYSAALGLGRERGHPAAVPGIINLFDVVDGAARRAELVKSLGRIGTPDAIRFLGARLPTEKSAYVRMEMAAAVAKSDDPTVASALDAAADAGQLEVVAGAHAYYLRARRDVDERLLLDAFRRYGGTSMANAFRESGRPSLVRAVAEEAAQPVQRPKTIEVR